MSRVAMMQAITTRYATLVETGLAVATQYAGGPIVPPTAAPWARMTILPASSEQKEITPLSSRRTRGLLVINLFVDPARGTGELDDLADQIEPLFMHKTVDEVSYGTPSLSNDGLVEGVWQYTLHCPFRYDDLVNP